MTAIPSEIDPANPAYAAAGAMHSHPARDSAGDSAEPAVNSDHKDIRRRRNEENICDI